jgi:hypothetical protein
MFSTMLLLSVNAEAGIWDSKFYVGACAPGSMQTYSASPHFPAIARYGNSSAVSACVQGWGWCFGQ